MDASLPDNYAALLTRLESARDFPANTCSASRHAEDIGSHLMSSPDARIDTESVQHIGESICATVCALYEARAELAAQRERRLIDVHSCHAGCTRAGCVNERLRLAASRYMAAAALLHGSPHDRVAIRSYAAARASLRDWLDRCKE